LKNTSVNVAVCNTLPKFAFCVKIWSSYVLWKLFALKFDGECQIARAINLISQNENIPENFISRLHLDSIVSFHFLVLFEPKCQMSVFLFHVLKSLCFSARKSVIVQQSIGEQLYGLGQASCSSMFGLFG
jgi:hypothetical protein